MRNMGVIQTEHYSVYKCIKCDCYHTHIYSYNELKELGDVALCRKCIDKLKEDGLLEEYISLERL